MKNLFYSNRIRGNLLFLENQEQKHCISSLRNDINDYVYVTDGNGKLYYCKIIDINKNEVQLSIKDIKSYERSQKIHLMIAPTKNHKRIEWMVEKLVEIGVFRISFIICKNSIRKNINLQRLNKIALSAMKQTQNYYLPIIDNIIDYHDAFGLIETSNRYIAHLCHPIKTNVIQIEKNNFNVCILIGPEGDFTLNEVNYAFKEKFKEISLGQNRLRTETAGIFASVKFTNNYE